MPVVAPGHVSVVAVRGAPGRHLDLGALEWMDSRRGVLFAAHELVQPLCLWSGWRLDVPLPGWPSTDGARLSTHRAAAAAWCWLYFGTRHPRVAVWPPRVRVAASGRHPACGRTCTRQYHRDRRAA